MKDSILNLFIKLWKMIEIRNIRLKLIIYVILVIINLPLETIYLPYIVLARFYNLKKRDISKKNISRIILSFFLVYLLLKVIEYIRHRLGMQLQIQMYIDTKKNMMENILNSYKKVQKELPLGKIINHMDNVPFLVEQIILKAICYLIPEFICLISIVIFLFYVDIWLGIIGTFFIIFYFYFISTNMKKPQDSSKAEAKHRAKHNQNILNTLDNILYILINNSFNFEKKNFKKNNDLHHHKFSICEQNNGNLFLKLDIISIVFLLIICIRLFFLILTKKKTAIYAGIFIVLLFGLEKLVDFKYHYIEICTSIYKSQVYLEDIRELNSDIKISLKHNNIKTNYNSINNNYSIIIKNLDYKYPKSNHNIFKDKSLMFQKNKITAIRGESGCGKTTLGKILMGLINPEKGEIWINKKNLSTDFSKRQKLIGYIPQNVKLFESSLLDNIRYTCDHRYSEKQVDNWIKNNKVKHILMKDKDDTDYLSRNVGVAGSELSGGQKQIVIILRTFLTNICSKKKKNIFILDEPTAALDPNTSNIIIELLKKFSKYYTIIIITHDKSIAKKCHKTILLS